MSYPINQYEDTWLGMGVAPKLRDGVQQENREGLPRWSVEVLHREEGRRSEVLLVTIASLTKPELEPMEPVTFTNLRVAEWSNDNGSGVYFTADSLA